MEVQEQVVPLLEQEPLQQEAHQSNPQGQELQQEVLLQGQEVLLLLEQAQAKVQVLEALLRVQVVVLAQVEAEVLDLALAVGLQQVVGPQGQVELVRQQGQAQERALAQAVALAEEQE